MSDSVRPRRQQQPTRLPRPWDSPGKNTGVSCHVLLQCMKVKSESEVTQSCLTLSNPMDCSLPGSSVHGIFQARVLEWGAIAFSHEDYKSMQIFIILISVLCFDAIISSYEVLEEREITLKRIWRNSLKILNLRYTSVENFPSGSDNKASVCLQCEIPGFDPWVGKIPWRRKWQPTPVLLP